MSSSYFYPEISLVLLPDYMQDEASYVRGVLTRDSTFWRVLLGTTIESLIPAGFEIVISINDYDVNSDNFVRAYLVRNFFYTAAVPRRVISCF